jgi:antitoxin CcdA
MNRPYRPQGTKRATNVSLNEELINEAKRLGINVSQACEAGLEKEVRHSLGEEWKRVNRDAIESSNEYVRKYGLPLAKYRMF